MHPLLVDRLLAYHSSLCSWTSTFLFPTSRGTVDLSPGTGDGAVPLNRYAFQPAKYPSGTTYLFDPNKYLGERSKTSLLLDISSSLGEASLHSVGCEKYTKRVEYSRHRLRCSYGNVSRSVTADNYSPHCFSKNNTIVQSLKRKRHPRELAPERMYTKKMKHDPKKRPTYPNTHNTDVDFFRLHVARLVEMPSLTARDARLTFMYATIMTLDTGISKRLPISSIRITYVLILTTNRPVVCTLPTWNHHLPNCCTMKAALCPLLRV